MENLNSKLPTRNSPSGFTLIELLVVVAVLGVLLGLTSSAIKFAVENTHKQRRKTQMSTLATAIVQYKYEYNKWPINSSKDSLRTDFNALYAGWANDNYVVTSCLLAENATDNPSRKAYIDYNTFFTWESEGSPGKNNRRPVKPLAQCTETERMGTPVVDFNGHPYKIVYSNNLVYVYYFDITPDAKYEDKYHLEDYVSE